MDEEHGGSSENKSFFEKEWSTLAASWKKSTSSIDGAMPYRMCFNVTGRAIAATRICKISPGPAAPT
jgi:hypothetical protein